MTQWGIGIEHELMILRSCDSNMTVVGKTILENLLPETAIPVSYLKKFINEKCLYTYQCSWEWSKQSLKEHFQRYPDHLDKLSTLLDLYTPLVSSTRTCSEFTYANLFESLVNSQHSDSLGDTNCIEFVTVNWKNNPISEAVREVALYQNIILQALNIINEFNTSKSDSAVGSESKSNKSIKSICLMDSNLTGTGTYYYPIIGSIFPEYQDHKFCLNYTGSYHLNLSLPYDLELLNKEESYYLDDHDKINKFIKKYYLSIKLQFINQVDTFQYYLTHNPIEEISKEIGTIEKINFSVTDLIGKYLKRYSDQQIKYNLPNIRKYFTNPEINYTDFYLCLTFKNKKIKKHCGISILYQLEDNLINLGNTASFNPIDQKFTNTIIQHLTDKYLSIEIQERINILLHCHNPSDFSEVTMSYFSGLHSIKNIEQKQIPILIKLESTGDETSYSSNVISINESSGSGKLRFVELKTLFQEPEYSDNLIQKIQNFILENFKSIITSAFYTVNYRVNLINKYTKSIFHQLHLKWGIAIQWILPLLLSACSSSDPFSIGDDDKLSELSLRIFIAGSSFVNLVDVMESYFPTGRGTKNFNQDSTLGDKCQDFIYQEKDFSGSEFRVCPGKGFNFGFELRSLDNFDIQHLDVVLEFLFLLADQTAHLTKSYQENPFSNQIVVDNILRILQQGWNTMIDPQYVQLLKQELEIEFDETEEILTPCLTPVGTAYDIINKIYRYLQIKYIKGGKGIGPYSQYTIHRESMYIVEGRDTIRLIPNINRLSWEYHFRHLIWQPSNEQGEMTNVKKIIIKVLEKYKQPNRFDLTDFQHQLTDLLGSPYSSDIMDIVYALNNIEVFP